MKRNFFRRVLKNGMTVVLEKRELPIVSVAFAVRNGWSNESKGEKGISHYIEHMLYKGTKNRTNRQIAEEIEWNGGELNGFTSELSTAYFCKMPSKHLNLALDVLSDLVKNPLFDEEELEKERKVIFEEIKLYNDAPTRYVLERIQSLLYEDPFGVPFIDTVESTNSIDRKKIVQRFKEVYQPNNMVLVVVGDADFEELVSFVEKNFSKESGKVNNFLIKPKNASKIETRIGLEQANLVFAYHVPLAGEDKSYAAEVLNVLMAGGMSSRLFNEIREKRNLAYAVKGDSSINKKFAYNFIYVGTTKENVEKVKDLILKEFLDVYKNLEQGELDRIKEQIIGQYQISMEESQIQMMSLLDAEVNGNAKDFYEFDKKIKAVKLGDIKEIAKNASEKYSFFALVPK